MVRFRGRACFDGLVVLLDFLTGGFTGFRILLVKPAFEPPGSLIALFLLPGKFFLAFFKSSS
jgi:hypothetical protein